MSSNHSIFTKSKNRLSLITDVGQKYSGLNNSKSPELCQRVTAFFECLNSHIGFPQTDLGRDNQTVFNLLLKSAYPEIMIDLADLIYVQHERPAVYLNFDHIHMNFKKDKVIFSNSIDVGFTVKKLINVNKTSIKMPIGLKCLIFSFYQALIIY